MWYATADFRRDTTRLAEPFPIRPAPPGLPEDGSRHPTSLPWLRTLFQNWDNVADLDHESLE
jgi:hypothetical protein